MHVELRDQISTVPSLRAESNHIGIILEAGQAARLPDRALAVQTFTRGFTMLFLLASLQQGGTPVGEIWLKDQLAVLQPAALRPGGTRFWLGVERARLGEPNFGGRRVFVLSKEEPALWGRLLLGIIGLLGNACGARCGNVSLPKPPILAS